MDLKSNSIVDESAAPQLGMYRMAVEAEYDIKIDKTFNIAPKDWRESTPTYDLRDQTDSEHLAKISPKLQLFFSDYKGNKEMLRFSGVQKGKYSSKHLKHLPAEEWVLQQPGIKTYIKSDYFKELPVPKTAIPSEKSPSEPAVETPDERRIRLQKEAKAEVFKKDDEEDLLNNIENT